MNWNFIFCLFIIQTFFVSGKRFNTEDKFSDEDFAKLNHSINWMFVHYHKTGHDLATHIAQVFLKKGCIASVNRFKQLNRVSLLPFLKDVFVSDITILAGPELQFSWSDALSQFNNHTFRFLHFVRNPYDMIVSGFLYHVEDPPPPPEVWLVDTDYNACNYNEALVMNEYAVKLGTLRGVNGTAIIRDQIHSVIELCKNITRQYPKGTTFNKMLISEKNKNMYNGIRLEAVRALLYKPGGDVLRMATNALYEDKRLSKRIFTADFPIGNKEKFLHTTSEVFAYLMNSKDELQHRENRVFWNCISKETAVKRVEKSAYIPIAPTLNNSITQATQHITVGHISSEERKQYIEQLKVDIVLGPLLAVVHEALAIYN